MLAASRDVPVPRVLLGLLFISVGSPLPTPSPDQARDPAGAPRPRGFSAEVEDYDRLEETTPAAGRTTPSVGPRQRCSYDPCDEAQVSCAVLSATTDCLCPGFTLHDTAPEAPSLKSVSWNGSDVVVEWCAPFSYVTKYVVTVGGQAGAVLGREERSGALGVVENIAEVCVMAENESGRSGSSCLMYHPRDDSMALKAGLIGGALGLLLLLLLAVLLWRRRRQRKQEAGISMRDTAPAQ